MHSIQQDNPSFSHHAHDHPSKFPSCASLRSNQDAAANVKPDEEISTIYEDYNAVDSQNSTEE
jgi:hypothetical protein